MLNILFPICLWLSLFQAPGEDAVLVQSEHYQISSDGSEAEASEWLDILEQHYLTLAELLGGTPELEEGGKLEIRVFETREQLLDGMQEMEGFRSKSSFLGMCMFFSRRVYVIRNEKERLTREILLHEATHQFESLFFAEDITTERDSGTSVLKEGLAHMMETHSWVDGVLKRDWPSDPSEMRWGVLQQLELAGRGDFSVNGLFQISMSSTGSSQAMWVGRAKAHLLVWFLLEANGAQSRKNLLDYLAKLDQGGSFSEKEFWSLVGQWQKLEPKFNKWARGLLPSWQAVWGEFKKERRGFSGGGKGLSLIRSSVPIKRALVMARLLHGEKGDLGLMVQYRPSGYSTYVMISSKGRYRVFATDGKGYREFATGKVQWRADKKRKLEAIHSAKGISIKLSGKVVYTIRGAKPSVMGVATDRCRAFFTRIEFDEI